MINWERLVMTVIGTTLCVWIVGLIVLVIFAFAAY